MDVGADEFEQSLPLLQELVLGADFVGKAPGFRASSPQPPGRREGVARAGQGGEGPSEGQGGSFSGLGVGMLGSSYSLSPSVVQVERGGLACPCVGSLCSPFLTSPGLLSTKKVSQNFCHLQRLQHQEPCDGLRLGTLVFLASPAGLDIEFTGLRSNLSGPQQISLFDLPSEWYLKTRQSVQQFTICQIGELNLQLFLIRLSVFSSIEGESNKYVAHSCNFFLFPTTFGILDSEFSFQASSVQFLNQYGFDYNKFLKNGIPYMNEEQEKKIKHNILTGNWRVRSSLDKDQIKVVIDEVTRWLDLAEEGDWMTLPGITGFQAFEVQLLLRKALPDIWTVMKDEGVTVKKVSKQHRWYLENTSCDRESCWKEKILLSARGFSVFFQMLVKAQKPLVGHNMMMDLLHLHEKFFRPLPESYDEFKLNIHNLFPVLIDTKNVTKDIWKELNFPRASNLSEVYEFLSRSSDPVFPHVPATLRACAGGSVLPGRAGVDGGLLCPLLCPQLGGPANQSGERVASAAVEENMKLPSVSPPATTVLVLSLQQASSEASPSPGPTEVRLPPLHGTRSGYRGPADGKMHTGVWNRARQAVVLSVNFSLASDTLGPSPPFPAVAPSPGFLLFSASATTTSVPPRLRTPRVLTVFWLFLHHVAADTFCSALPSVHQSRSRVWGNFCHVLTAPGAVPMAPVQRMRGEQKGLLSVNVFYLFFFSNSDLNPAKNSGPVIIHARRCEKYVETKYPHEAAYDAFLCGSVLLKVAHLLLWRVHGVLPIPEPSFPLYLDVLAPYVNQVNLIRARVPTINFSGPDYPSIRPPILVVTVRRWPGVSEQQVYHEFQNLGKFDVRRLVGSQFLLLTNKFKDTRSILKEYRCHPTLQVSLYRYWRHSPNVSCLLQ
ncbi:hypothetical protein J1605_017390 [Eschrichtius robustus]|uniref:Poly(A)-specific ribonuclease PNLDC1 n=1 Tax=Eschrichtius robustus TaxID=9764 RepID=A0AB34HWE6_ESCRO|nr:hypothetical protein J1605_017390 [Eschrichtius robustus]